MGFNRVQFQRGLPMAEFMERYGTQEPTQWAKVVKDSTIKVDPD